MRARQPAELSIPQPEGEPVVLFNMIGDYSTGRPRTYTQALRELGGSKNPSVLPHLLASVVESAGSEVSLDEVVQIAQDLQATDEIVREPNVPVIYKLHCEHAVGITPDEGTSGFRVVDSRSSDSKYPHLNTHIATKSQFKVRRGANFEHDEETLEDTDLRMYTPLSFLSSDDPEAVDKFLNHRARWMRYPNSHVVAGHEAVKAFLAGQARKDLLGEEEGRVYPEGFVTGWSMIALGGLRRLGYDAGIGKPGDFVHRAGMEALADVVASSTGYEQGIARRRHDYHDGMILRRLIGVEFNPEQDAQAVGEMAAERVFVAEEAQRFNGLLHGDESEMRSHLTEIAGNFMDHFRNLSPSLTV